MNGETSLPRSSARRGHGLDIRGRDQVTPLYGGALVPGPASSASPIGTATRARCQASAPHRRTCAGTGIR